MNEWTERGLKRFEEMTFRLGPAAASLAPRFAAAADSAGAVADALRRVRESRAASVSTAKAADHA